MTGKKDPRLERAGVDGYNKPKKTPGHPTKSHVVVAKDRGNTKHFGLSPEREKIVRDFIHEVNASIH